MTDYEEVPGQLGLLDALERVERNAAEEWKSAARAALDHLIDRGDPFTADDAWMLLASTDATTHEPRALGALIREASREGRIRSTGQYVTSSRPECHQRPVAVWLVAR